MATLSASIIMWIEWTLIATSWQTATAIVNSLLRYVHVRRTSICSPSSLASKNELLRGGLSTLKSAGNLVAKKFDEIKEAISANSTPVKPSLGWVLYCIQKHLYILCIQKEMVELVATINRVQLNVQPVSTSHHKMDMFLKYVCIVRFKTMNCLFC